VLKPGDMEETKKKPVRQHEDLIAWQLCSQLRRLVLRYTRTGPTSRDPDYRGQLRRAVRSACYNTSEGFYRYKHGEFGNHLNIARGSLGEALDQIDDGAENKYFTVDQHNEMRRICIRAMKCNVALRRSWEPKAPDGLQPKTAAERH
jgi:four helix bundle protein